MEYTDSKLPIVVSNIYESVENKSIFFLLNENNKRQLFSLSEGLSKIEEIFLDLIDLLTKKSLNNIGDRIEYHVAGGKAINNFIKSKYLNKSFDFDIHVLNKSDINNLCSSTVAYMNNELKLDWNKHIRYQLYKKLERLNFVSPDEKEYYINKTNDLFYYGERVKPTFSIKSMFIKLKLQKNVFINSNNDDIININNFIRNKGDNLTSLGGNINIMYIPFSDIDEERNVNFGAVIYNSPNPSYSLIKINSIKYLDYIMAIYNLIKYTEFSSNKSYSNIKKLRKIVKILYTNCNFRNSYRNDKILNSIENLKQQLLQGPLKINFNKTAKHILKKFPIYLYYDDSGEKKELFNHLGLYKIEIFEYLYKLINNYVGSTEKIDKCYLTLNQNINIINDPNYIRFLNLYDLNIENIILQKIEELTSESDINLYILYYTGSLYRSVNSYMNLTGNNLDGTKFTPYTSVINNISITLSNLKIIQKNANIINVNTIDNVEKALTEIDNVFQLFHNRINNLEFTNNEINNFGKNNIGKNVFNYINDTFTVYGFHLIYNYANYDGFYSNISTLKSGDIFIYPQYISTTWLSDTNLGAFFENTKSLLRITIKKSNKNWILLNRYSVVPNESEILIKRNSIFIIKQTDTTVVNINGTRYDVNIIDLELLDDIPHNIMKSIYLYSGTSNYYDNPIKSQLFNYTVKNVYTKFLIKEFKDVKILNKKKIKCNSMVFGDTYLNVEINGEKKIIFRPNHSLVHTMKVCAWIYIYSLYLIKYDNSLYNIITPKFILQICTAGLFLVSGRDSELGALNNLNNCNELTYDEKYYYNRSHGRYLEQSSINFEKFVINDNIIFNNIYSQEEVNNLSFCIKNYYYIYKNNINHIDKPMAIKPINKLISKIFYLSHSIDLIRCKGLCEYTVPIINFVNENYEKESEIIRNLSIELCTGTGDRVFVDTFIDSNNKKKYDVNLNIPYNDYKFYENSTDCNKCIETILNIITPYTNELINDIEENQIEYAHKNLDPFKDNTSSTFKTIDLGDSTINRINPNNHINPNILNEMKLDNMLHIDPNNPINRINSIPSDRIPSNSNIILGGVNPIENVNIDYINRLKDDNDYITDVDKCIMETENKFLGVTIYSPLSKIKELENKYNFKYNFKYNIKVTPFISDFSKEEFKDTYDFNDYISKSLTYYESLGLKLFTDKTYITKKEDIKIFNKITKDEYFKINAKNNQIMTKTPINPLRNEIYVATGGMYYEKYIKYKQKYFKLKNKNKN